MADEERIPDTLDGPRSFYHNRCCIGCKHRLGGRGLYSCAAFPDGIPDDIFFDRVNHLEPYPGDGGLQWEPSGEPVKPLSEETLRRIRESGV